MNTQNLTVAAADRLNAIAANFRRTFAAKKPTAPKNEVVDIKTVGMEASVRYIAHANDIGVKPALCFRGKDTAFCLINDDEGIRLARINAREFDTAAIVNYRGAPYSIVRCAEQLQSFTLRRTAARPITAEAQALIDLVLGGEIVTESNVTAPAVSVAAIEPTTAKSTAPIRSTLVARICAEIGMEPTIARRHLRAAGMSAPYTDEAAIRRVLEK